jgi:hypothetical protein
MQSKECLLNILGYATTKKIKDLKIGQTGVFLPNPKYKLNNNIYVVAGKFKINLTVHDVLTINVKLESVRVLLVTRLPDVL